MLKRLQRHAGLVNFAIHPPHLTKLCLVNLKCGNFEVGDPEYGEARNPDYGEARNMTTVRLITPRALRVRGRLRSLADAVEQALGGLVKRSQCLPGLDVRRRDPTEGS